MAVLTAETVRKRRRIEEREWEKFSISNVKIFRGAIVCVNASGYIVNGSDTAALKCRGVASETVDNSAGSAGDKQIEVEWGIHVLFDSTGITAADEGSLAYISDNNVVTNAATATNDIPVGTITKYDGSNKTWVAVARDIL
jgi:hypothetical protein